jgi:hypothetical protein
MRLLTSISFLGSLGEILLVGGLDDTDGDGLLHVTHGEPSEGRVLGEGLDAEGLGGLHEDEGRVSSLDELGLLFSGLSSSSVDLGLDFSELAGDVRSVAVEDGGVAVFNLSGVVHDDDLGDEGLDFFGGIVLGVTADVSSLDVLDGETLDVESDVVSGDGLGDGGVVHFDRLDVRLDVSGGEGYVHSGLKDTGLDSADGDRSNTSDLVDVLKGDTEGLVSGSLGGLNLVKSFQEGGALVPRSVGGSLQHVVTVPSGNGDEGDGVRLVADLLQEVGDLLLDFVVSLLREVDGLLVHLVAADDHLPDAEGEGEESVLSGLSFLGDTSLELSLGGGDHEDGAVGLGGAGNHVLDEVPVARGVNDGEVVFGALELPKGDIDGDTSLPLGLELVHDPSVLEGGLAGFGGFLLILLDGPLVDTTAFVDEVAGGGRLSRVDVTDHDQVDVSLLLL